MSLAPGSRIGRIRVDALIGAGGMGEVYRGHDERLDRPVALKVIQPNRLVDAAVRSRFIREARLLSKLEHPNICRIYDVIEDESGNYLVLELIEGRTLRDAQAEGISRAEAVRIALHIARVLAFAHARGIIHRDLKPDNVMLTSSGEVKVLDFGLARLMQEGESTVHDTPDLASLAADAASAVEQTVLMDDQRTQILTSMDWARTSAGTLVGTVHYMSPEQARGRPLTPASDLYTFGIVLYELLSDGQSPYGDTPSTRELLAKVRQADLTLVPSRDRDAMRLVRRLTDPDPEERPDAAETVRELERIVARPQRVRRNAIIATLAAILIVITGAAIFTARRVAERPVFAKRGEGKIAVLPFRNETKSRGSEWIELGVMDMVMQGLGGMHRVQLVPADDVLKAMKNLGVAHGAELPDVTRGRLLEALGADTLLSASVRSDAGRYDISYRLLLRDGDEAPHEVGAAALPDAANEVAARLTRRLEPDAQKVDIRERYSFDDFANIAYAIGRQEYFTKGAQAAAPYFAVCIERDPEFAWAKLQLARCRNESGDVAATDALLDDAQKLAKRKGDRKLSIEVDLVRCDVDIERGKYEDVERIAKATLAESQQLGDMALTGHAQRTLGMVAWHRGRPDDARMWDRAALQTFTKLRSQIDVARIYNNMGLLEADGGDSRAAEQQFERAMSIAERYDDFAMMMKVLGNLATARLDALDFPGAERYARRQLTLARKSGSRGDEIYALVNGAIALWAMDRVEEALRDTEQAAQIAHEMQNPRVEAIALANAGFARANLGQFDAAKTAFDRATTIIATLESPDVAQRVDALAGYWLARIGKLDEAEQRTARAETVKVTIASLTSRARLSYARGDYKAAESAMRRAHELHDGWLPTHQRMWDAYAESARTGKPSTIAFESAPR